MIRWAVREGVSIWLDVTMARLNVLVLSVLFAVAAATNVQQCPGSKSISTETLSNNVQLSPCQKPPCKLKKGTDQHISIKFTPDHDIPNVKNRVTADVFGVPLPFVGVDGNSVCDKLETETGKKASCPLKAGTTYVYKDSFPVLNFYPSIRLKVHWALQNNDNKIICFEVPARIS